MTNKELFLTFFEVESATTIGIKYHHNEKIQLLIRPTKKNKFMDRLPIRIIVDVDEHYSRVMGNCDEMFKLFNYLGFNTNEVINVCCEIHEDMGNIKLIVP